MRIQLLFTISFLFYGTTEGRWGAAVPVVKEKPTEKAVEIPVETLTDDQALPNPLNGLAGLIEAVDDMQSVENVQKPRKDFKRRGAQDITTEVLEETQLAALANGRGAMNIGNENNQPDLERLKPVELDVNDAEGGEHMEQEGERVIEPPSAFSQFTIGLAVIGGVGVVLSTTLCVLRGRRKGSKMEELPFVNPTARNEVRASDAFRANLNGQGVNRFGSKNNKY